MTRRARRLLPELLVAALAAPAARAQTKVAVLPFVALSGEIPAKTGAKAALMLVNELKNVESVAVVDAPFDATPVLSPAEGSRTASDPVDAGREALKEAQALERRRKFGQAAEVYKKAIAQLESAAERVDGVGELADARAALATVLYRIGDDAGGERELRLAVALAPARDFPGQETSPLFTATVRKAREGVLKAQRGSVRIDSVPLGCVATLDGQAVGRTPVLVKDVPVGTHLWRVELPTSETVGGAVAVQGAVTARVTGSGATAGPYGQLAATLLRNRLDAAAVEKLKQVATAAAADLVVFGTLRMVDAKDMAFDAFLYAAGKDAVARLERPQFDPDLLNAGLELFKMAGELGAKGADLGTPVKPPAIVAADQPPPEAVAVSDTRYRMPGEEEGEERREGTIRKPIQRRPVTRRSNPP